jgi:hypothetical protein
MAELMDYVRTLAEDIGPRPATTDAEHRAADWLAMTFGEHGLDTEIQEFESPRTYAWAYVIYHALTLGAAFTAGFWPFLAWPAFAVAALVAYFMMSDLDTKAGLTKLMPKGPSQNVIARHVPRARRGERLRKIVIVAHYDSARSSLAFSPGMVGSFHITFSLMKWITLAVPVLLFLMALPFTSALDPWIWYVTLAASAYLIVPLVINVHRELFMPFVAGANDNASGVAAMLGVMGQLVPAPDARTLATTGQFPAVRRGRAAAVEADVIPEGAELEYEETDLAEGETPAIPDDFRWADQTAAEPERQPQQAVLDFETIEFAAVDEDTARRETPSSSDPRSSGLLGEEAGDDSGADDFAAAYDQPERTRQPKKERGGLLGRLTGRTKKQRDDEDVSEWLGVDDSFSARKAGREIGSWDNFDETDDDDDGMGWKGGWAGDDPIEDPEFAASEAARIRRRVTETVDRDLTEKEVWFVATGAEEVGTCGMQALLRDYGEELKDALIINIDGCGAGHLYWASQEGMARRYRADRRLVALARRVSRETETVIKPRIYKGLSTDATPALARGYKAMSVMAFDAAGLPVNWHWSTDTVSNIDPALIEKTAEFVAAMVREA